MVFPLWPTDSEPPVRALLLVALLHRVYWIVYMWFSLLGSRRNSFPAALGVIQGRGARDRPPRIWREPALLLRGAPLAFVIYLILVRFACLACHGPLLWHLCGRQGYVHFCVVHNSLFAFFLLNTTLLPLSVYIKYQILILFFGRAERALDLSMCWEQNKKLHFST